MVVSNVSDINDEILGDGPAPEKSGTDNWGGHRIAEASEVGTHTAAVSLKKIMIKALPSVPSCFRYITCSRARVFNKLMVHSIWEPAGVRV